MALIRTPLGRARGLGSAKHGVGHFLVERVTSVALAPLVIWGAVVSVGLAHGGYEGATAFLRAPINAALASLLVIAAFWHMQVGMRVIIEDYFQKTATKGTLLVLNILATWLGGALALVAILRVALSPAGVAV
jgi:succinate dehydrogenase / fumarate reductase membrane anchor subunit